jgi:hypothetical protein
MDRRFLWGLVAVAFLVGAMAGAALLFEGGGPRLKTNGPGALLIQVRNVGHDANITVESRAVDGGRAFTWNWVIPDGSAQMARHMSPPGTMAVTVRVAWSAPAREARGDASYLVDPADCPGQDIMLSILTQTANGVAISRTGPSRCV